MDAAGGDGAAARTGRRPRDAGLSGPGPRDGPTAQPGAPTPPRATAPSPPDPRAVPRRRVLALALLAPAAAGLAACSRGARRDAPDPLIALAGAARADAALAAAALAADPGLRDRVEPLRAARAEHAAALEAEVVRAGGTLPSTAPGPPPTAPDGPPATGAPGASPSGTAAPVTLARVRESAAAAQQAAARLVPGLPADRVGLVAEVAACCAAYAEVLA